MLVSPGFACRAALFLEDWEECMATGVGTRAGWTRHLLELRGSGRGNRESWWRTDSQG